MRRRFGERFDQAELDRITAFARERGIGLHMDGARLFLQSACTGVDVAEYARPFDTVYVSLYKYFNSASGAILAGPRALLDDMYHTRRMFGAGLPGAWPFAGGGLCTTCRASSAASDGPSRPPRRSSSSITRHDAFTVERMPAPTNLFRLRVSAADPAGFRARLRERGVDLGGAPDPTAPSWSASTRHGTARRPSRWRTGSRRPSSGAVKCSGSTGMHPATSQDPSGASRNCPFHARWAAADDCNWSISLIHH